MSILSRPSLALTVAAVVLAGATAFAQTAVAGPFGGGPGMMRGDHSMSLGGPMMGGGRGLQRLLDGVSATPEQRAEIERIANAARTDVQARRQAAQALRDQARTLFTQPQVDAQAAEALRKQMLAQHDAASQRQLQTMLEISRVLTPEQRQQISERMQARRDMRQRHWRERQALDGKPS